MKYLFPFFLISNYAFGQPIDTAMAVRIGGINQYIHIKGKDAFKPVLLFLHGGPGGSLMKQGDRITRRLQEYFVVVQWDQRETGRTLELNRSPKPLALQLFYNDTHDIVDTLLRWFRQPKLYLAGYSWGSGLGFYMADKYPELLYAYIAISPVINQFKSDSISLALLKRTMGSKARNELSQVKIPFENADQLYYHRKWLMKHEGQRFVEITFRKSFVQGWAATWFDVWSKSTEVNQFQNLPVVNCPIYFFAGAKDYNTNATVTEEYFNKVTAPKKDLFLFREAGHGLPETHYEEFQETIINKILPDTFDRY